MAKRKFRKFDAYKGVLLKNAELYVLVVVILLVVFRFLIGISWVDGDSMDPTLKNGTAVVYSRVSNHYETGDILSIKMAYGEYYIKRVVALPGDIVNIVDGKLLVNGVPEEGNYARGDTAPEDAEIHYPYTVPGGRLFVLGDNRPVSIDSRSFGPVSFSQVQGKVILHLG